MTGSATRSRENTRARLLEAAGLVFAEVGLDGATVEAVCERAGFTRGAFYSNFESKDELFLELAGAVSVERLAAVRARVAELNEAGALAQDCDATTLVRQVMDTGSDDRLGVMLLSEIRLKALRDHAWGKAYVAQEEEMLSGIARVIDDIVAGGAMSLRVESVVAARMLLIVWEGATVRGAMAGQDDEELRRTGSAELGRLVSLLLG
ncbi:MAG: TetR/AcrR family transcriptional regulator [Actinobacteria bacterium]|nr:TetR/AcrR family transcriptional regulator [Actinomycetota bacterium]